MILTILDTSGIIQYLSFCDWLVSLIITFSRPKLILGSPSDYLSVLLIACYPLQVSSLTILTHSYWTPAQFLLPLPTLLMCSSPRVLAVPVFLPWRSSLTQHDYLSLTIFKSLLKHYFSKASPRLISSKFQSTFSFLVPLSYLSLFIFFLYSSLLCVYYLFLYTRVKATSLMYIYFFFFTDISVLPACRTVLKHSKHTVGMFWMNRWMNEYMLLCASTKPSNEEKLDPILNKQIVLWEGLG